MARTIRTTEQEGRARRQAHGDRRRARREKPVVLLARETPALRVSRATQHALRAARR
jgi:hypothetical protein